MKKLPSTRSKVAFLALCMSACLHAYAQDEAKDTSSSHILPPASVIAPTLQAADFADMFDTTGVFSQQLRQFAEATGCIPKITSRVSSTGKNSAWVSLLQSFLGSLDGAQEDIHENIVSIDVEWTASSNGLLEGKMRQAVHNASSFTPEALQRFKDSIEAFHEVGLDSVRNSKAGEYIIAALEALQKNDESTGEPKSVKFSMSSDLSRPIHVPFFDDNDKNYCSAYPTYKENEPYVYTGISANVYVHVTPPNQVGKIEVTEGAVLQADKTSPLKCSIFPDDHTTIVAYKKGDESRKPLGKMNVIKIVENKNKIEVSICKVKYKTEQNYPDVKVNTIEDMLKKIYGVIGQTFMLSNAMVEIESPDINANEMLDVGERDILEASFPKVTGYTIFIINQGIKGREKDTEAAGYGYIVNEQSPKNRKNPIMVITQKAFPETYAHEVGHTVFGLIHPFEEFRNHGKDPYNIMDYGRARNQAQLRAYQVKQILKVTL
jgi:hypothetical protein